MFSFVNPSRPWILESYIKIYKLCKKVKFIFSHIFVVPQYLKLNFSFPPGSGREGLNSRINQYNVFITDL